MTAHSDHDTATASPQAVPFAYISADKKAARQKGSVLFYIFIAIGLLSALTLSLVNTSKEGITTQTAQRMTENLYVQANGIKSAILECVHTYPSGGAVDPADNPNVPYPLDPSDENNPEEEAGNDQVRHLQCPGAPSGHHAIYDGVGTTGRFLPQQVNGFSEWIYQNGSNGVYIQTTGQNEQAITTALARLQTRFDTCEAELNYGGCGATCLTIFLLRVVCPGTGGI